MSFTVSNQELRKALSAVSAHAYAKEELPALSTIVFDTTPGGEVMVTASNGFTTGIAVLQPVKWDGDEGQFAITLRDVPALFKVFPDDAQDIQFDYRPDERSPLEADPEKVTRRGQLIIMDVSGIFDGKKLSLRPANLWERDVTKLWHEVAVRFRAIRTVPRRTPVNSKHLVLFKAAAAAYKEPLIVEMGDARGNLIVRCGESFVGYLVATDLEPETEAHYDTIREEWKRRLPMRLNEVKDGS